jgi:hypothetical protein
MCLCCAVGKSKSAVTTNVIILIVACSLVLCYAFYFACARIICSTSIILGSACTTNTSISGSIVMAKNILMFGNEVHQKCLMH